MRFSLQFFEGTIPPATGSASGVITITGSVTGAAIGGDVFTYEAADILPWDIESQDELPMSIESADLTPLVVSS